MVAPFLFIPKQYSVVWLYHDFIQHIQQLQHLDFLFLAIIDNAF